MCIAHWNIHCQGKKQINERHCDSEIKLLTVNILNTLFPINLNNWKMDPRTSLLKSLRNKGWKSAHPKVLQIFKAIICTRYHFLIGLFQHLYCTRHIPFVCLFWRHLASWDSLVAVPSSFLLIVDELRGVQKNSGTIYCISSATI